VIRSGHNDTSKYKCWKLFRATFRGITLVRRPICNGGFTLLPYNLLTILIEISFLIQILKKEKENDDLE